VSQVAPSGKVLLLDLKAFVAFHILVFNWVTFVLIQMLLQIVDQIYEQNSAQLFSGDSFVQRDSQGVSRDHI
jgi:hypothetical protein